MSLSFITGAAGSGKTSVARELVDRGYEVHDTDDPNHTGIAGWHERESGMYVAGFNELEVTEELLETHVWRLTDAAVAGFQERARTHQVYLAGRLREAEAVITASDYLVYLTVSSETIADRLVKRAQIPGEVEWGKEAWQIEKSITVNQELEMEYRALGAIMINAERPLETVADEIIGVTAG
jgi:adenylate kinase family enzyme